MGRWWDETQDGSPSRVVDRATWAERLADAGDPPPRWMGPQGRRSAWRAAVRLRWVAGMTALAGMSAWVCAWSLRALQAGG